MQETLRRCYEERRPRLAAAGCGWDDLLWAVQVLHSRCFFDPSMGLHLSVPGGRLKRRSCARACLSAFLCAAQALPLHCFCELLLLSAGRAPCPCAYAQPCNAARPRNHTPRR